MILTLFYFALALMTLVLVHEFGHFMVARLCGVRVLRFSFGFGKVLKSWYDKRGTEYAFSLIPLGGYVKMLDESEEEVPKEEQPFAFNRQSITARALIVLAGPMFNFIFAFVMLWCVLVMGIPSLAPITEQIKPGSLASKAGLTNHLEIISVAGQPVGSWREVQLAMMPFLGTADVITLKVKSLQNGRVKTLNLALADWHLDTTNPDMLGSLGIEPFVPTLPPIVGQTLKDSPAFMAGIQKGDVILSLNGQAVQDWFDVVQWVKHHPNQQLKMKISRQGTQKNFDLLVGGVLQHGKLVGYLGVKSKPMDWPKELIRIQREGPIRALGMAWGQTTMLIRATFSFIGQFCMGKLSLENISGPVGIAQGAGASGRSGLPYYFSFLALLSISLGVLNILPIPLLDGGHLLYCLLEFIWRRPLPDSFKVVGGYLGMGMLMMLMFIAFRNDLSRVF